MLVGRTTDPANQKKDLGMCIQGPATAVNNPVEMEHQDASSPLPMLFSRSDWQLCLVHDQMRATRALRSGWKSTTVPGEMRPAHVEGDTFAKSTAAGFLARSFRIRHTGIMIIKDILRAGT